MLFIFFAKVHDFFELLIIFNEFAPSICCVIQRIYLSFPYQTHIYLNVLVENGTYSIKTLANNFTRDYVYMSNKNNPH